MNSTSKPVEPAPTARRVRAARPRRWLPWLAGGLLLAVVAIGLRPQPAPVEVGKVATGLLRSTINEEGKTRLKQRYMVSAPVAGRLRRVEWKAGAEIVPGQTVLAVLDPLASSPLDARSRALAEARRDVASAQVEKARKAHEFAASEAQRFQKLFAEKSISVQELEPIQWRETSAAKDLVAAESYLRQAEAELADFGDRPGASSTTAAAPMELRAPAGTRILKVFEESARVVTAGTPILEVGDPTDLEIVIEVLSRDGASMATGARVEVTQWGGEKPLEARVRLVEPAAFTKVSALGVEEQRVNVVADFVTPVEQRRALGDRYRVDAQIVVWEAEQTLKVPAGGLFRRGQQWMAYVLEQGRAAVRQVTTGRSGGGEVQVLGGLKDGETIVLYPGDRIKPSMRIRPIQVAP